MRGPLLVVDDPAELVLPEDVAALHTVASSRDYVDLPRAYGGRGARVVNLTDSGAYQSLGYYVSLLAEARGHRVIPSVETALELSSDDGWRHALPGLDAALRRDLADTDGAPPTTVYVLLGRPSDARLQRFARLLFDGYRAPIVRVELEAGTGEDGAPEVRVGHLGLGTVGQLEPALRDMLVERLGARARNAWRPRRPRTPPRHSLAVLHDPDEALPPTSVASLRHFARVAERARLEVVPVRRQELGRLAEFDALLIRETTSIRDHTWRFAQRARQQNMPVIDDPESMIRCTNKVYLWERLVQAALPTPATRVLRERGALEAVADELGFPLVVKVPDGSFSRGVSKVGDFAELEALCRTLFTESDLLLAQRYVPTGFDWRIGVLGGRALFACQYLMARNHWQIVRHRSEGRAIQGAHRALALEAVPANVLDIATRAAALIGDGFYGVDLKETDEGVVVIEINDNPNLERGVEDGVGRDEIWLRLAEWFVERLRR